MTFTPLDQKYDKGYHGYPVHTQDKMYEGAFKRYSALPTPVDVYNYALLGLPKHLPLTNEMITPEFAAQYLESAVTEIEMSIGCVLSETEFFHSEDYIDGMFTSNFMGINLPKWPATQIDQVVLKYAHTNTPNSNLYQTYGIPPAWIYLQKNKINIVAAIGAVSVSTNSPSVSSAGGIFTYITGFGRGAYQPGTIQVVYQAGFSPDKFPSSIADLVKTWAAHRFLIDIIPVLFPTSGVSVSVDGISQSVSYSIQAMLSQRVTAMEQKKKELSDSLKKAFSRTIKMSFIGS